MHEYVLRTCGVVCIYVLTQEQEGAMAPKKKKSKKPGIKHGSQRFVVCTEGYSPKNETSDSIKRFSDILLLGHDWSEDQDRLLGLLKLCQENNTNLDGHNFPRIGVIGSRSKWQSFSQKAQNQGIETQLLDQVICPIGINIGAESPEEIAIAVTAQILSLSKGVSPEDKNWRDSN